MVAVVSGVFEFIWIVVLLVDMTALVINMCTIQTFKLSRTVKPPGVGSEQPDIMTAIEEIDSSLEEELMIDPHQLLMKEWLDEKKHTIVLIDTIDGEPIFGLKSHENNELVPGIQLRIVDGRCHVTFQ